MNVYDIIRYPHITEKSSNSGGANDQQLVAFKVQVDANKAQIMEAVEAVFEVKVDQVRTCRFQGKMKRQGRKQGRRPSWKKAYVTLKPGRKIEFFEGV